MKEVEIPIPNLLEDLRIPIMPPRKKVANDEGCTPLKKKFKREALLMFSLLETMSRFIAPLLKGCLLGF